MLDDDEDCGLGEDDDAGEFEELLNEKLQQARTLVDEEETVASRDLLNDVMNHGNSEQEVAAMAMVAEIGVIIAAAKEAAADSELASEDQDDGEDESA